MRFIFGLVLVCGVSLFGQTVETAKNKQARAAISKNGKQKGKAKASKNITTANRGNEVWYEIKAMRMDKQEASLPGYFYRDSFKTNDRRGGGRRSRLQNRRHHNNRRYRPHVVATKKDKHVQHTTKLDAAVTKTPQQLNFTRNLISTVAEQHTQFNFETRLDATTPKESM